MATVELYVAATAEFTLESINRSVEQFVTGKVERDNRAFAPSADEFSGNVRLWSNAISKLAERDGPELHSGLISMDFGAGRIDMRGLTVAEQDQIIANKGRAPDGKPLSYLSTSEIRSELTQRHVGSVEYSKSFSVPKLKGLGNV